jgi:hypothetical protein
MYEDELMHYGRKGMKWYQHIYGKEQGHAKYANTDKLEVLRKRSGKAVDLTPYGKKVLERIVSSEDTWKFSNNDAVEDALKKKGVKHVDELSDLVSKNTKLTRYSTKKEKLSSRRIYASITNVDKSVYKEDAAYGELGFSKKKNFYEITLKTNKDILVANGKSVFNYLREHYDSKELEKCYKKVKEYDIFNIYDQTSFAKLKSKNKQEREVGSYIGTITHSFAKQINKTLYDNPKAQQEIIDHFSALGYAAMVDIEDRAHGYQYPLIVFNPERDLSIEKYTKVNAKDVLEHSGVKGMEWYVRRFQPYTQVPTRSGKIGKFIGSYTDSSLDHRVKELEEQAIKSWNRYKELRAKYGKNDERVKSAKEDANRDGAFYGAMNKRLNVDTEQKAEIGRRVLESINQNEAVSS